MAPGEVLGRLLKYIWKKVKQYFFYIYKATICDITTCKQASSDRVDFKIIKAVTRADVNLGPKEGLT